MNGPLMCYLKVRRSVGARTQIWSRQAVLWGNQSSQVLRNVQEVTLESNHQKTFIEVFLCFSRNRMWGHGILYKKEGGVKFSGIMRNDKIHRNEETGHWLCVGGSGVSRVFWCLRDESKARMYLSLSWWIWLNNYVNILTRQLLLRLQKA